MYIRFVENVLKNLRFVNVNNMKQTSIPEKIKTEIGCGEVNTPIGIAMKFSQYARIISSLIDVLTEQEDRLDRHNDRIAETNKHFGNKIKDLQKEIKQLKHDLAKYMYQDNLEKELQKDPDCMLRSTKQSYTAMRSTGKTATEVVEAIKRHNELEYCKCAATIIHYHKDESGWWVCDKCGKQSSEPPAPIKSQEEIREKLYTLVKSWGPCIADNCPTCYDYADKILAIVKGEKYEE